MSERFYLRFNKPSGLERLPQRRRGERIKRHFAGCLRRLEPLPPGVALVERIDLLLSALVEGSPEGIEALRRRLAETQSGVLVPNVPVVSPR
jgi:hypothetical protein